MRFPTPVKRVGRGPSFSTTPGSNVQYGRRPALVPSPYETPTDAPSGVLQTLGSSFEPQDPNLSFSPQVFGVVDDSVQSPERDAISSHFPSLTLTTDASKSGWGSHLLHFRLSGVWSPFRSKFHINILELRAVFFSLCRLLHVVRGKLILVRTDNMAVAMYLNKQGGT